MRLRLSDPAYAERLAAFLRSVGVLRMAHRILVLEALGFLVFQALGRLVAPARLRLAGRLPAGLVRGGALALAVVAIGHGLRLPFRSILEPRGRGGTGRRDGFRSRWAARPLEVRLLSPAPQERSTARRTPTDEFRRLLPSEYVRWGS